MSACGAPQSTAHAQARRATTGRTRPARSRAAARRGQPACSVLRTMEAPQPDRCHLGTSVSFDTLHAEEATSSRRATNTLEPGEDQVQPEPELELVIAAAEAALVVDGQSQAADARIRRLKRLRDRRGGLRVRPHVGRVIEWVLGEAE